MNKEEVVQLNKLKRKTGLFFIIVMGVMLICFIFLIQFEVNKEKISASYTAEDTVRKIETQLGRYLENSEMFKNIISSEHTISDEQFNQLASYMKKNKNVIEAYELAPNGIIEKAYPLKGNEKVIGMNMLELPERQKEANIARKSGEYTIAGPYELKQGGTGALLFDPIYINDGNEKKFWGFSILVLNWDAFLEELEVDKLEDATYHFKVWKEGNNGKHVTIMSCGHSSLNHTLSVACEVPNDGTYTLTETMAPTEQGYVRAESVTFEVGPTGDIQRVEMKDDFTKVEISKADMTDGRELPGAKLKITDANGSSIAEWETNGQPHRIERIKGRCAGTAYRKSV